ncbi:MAG: hypothetical protein KJ927_05525, partial [Candidatus Eisenbacteria bacterium]|nr:hypothetical protein [Candidatus Eisenbacteria bacterium]
MTTKQMTKMTNRKVEQKGLFFRTAEIDRDSIDIENRTVELVFSTETPVDRWWGIEILDHNPKSVRMERMKKGCAVLVNHMVTEHVGVVDRASIDADKKGRARARFGNSVKAKEAFDDVVNDVRKFWSIYYRLHDAILERKGKDGALGTYRVIDWEPYELSLASIPADINAETGREADKSFTFTIREDSDMTKPEVGQEEEARSVQDPPENRHPEISVRAREEIESAARSSEQKRARQILTFGEMFKLPDLARTFI